MEEKTTKKIQKINKTKVPNTSLHICKGNTIFFKQVIENKIKPYKKKNIIVHVI